MFFTLKYELMGVLKVVKRDEVTDLYFNVHRNRGKAVNFWFHLCSISASPLVVNPLTIGGCIVMLTHFSSLL